MPRVLILTNSLTGGGAERSMNMLANELYFQGFTVGLVPINTGPVDQIHPVCEVMPLNRRWPGGLKDTITAFRQFNQIVKEWEPDILILNCDLPEMFGAFLTHNVSLIIVEHTSLPWNTRKSLGFVVRKVLSLKRAKWIAVSNHLEAWPNGNRFSAVIPNPVNQDVEKIEAKSKMPLKRIVFIGRLSFEKRPQWLLEISRFVAFPIIVIGDGKLRHELEKSAIEEGLTIKFLGQQLRPWDLIDQGDLLVIPSEYEGDGLVLIEAMLYRCPVLVADIPDLRRFNLAEDNYCLNPQDFIRTIRKYERNLELLIIPNSLCQEELSSRSIKSVGSKWMSMLKTLNV